MRRNKKRTIFFDAVGTLFVVNGTVGFQYSRLALKFGIRKDPAVLEQRFREAFKKSPPMAFPGQSGARLQQAEKEWWYNLVRHAFQDIAVPQFNPFFEAVYSFFAGEYQDFDDGLGKVSAWRLYPETRDLLRELRFFYKENPLGMITNFDSRIHSVLRHMDIDSFFQTVTFSTEEGIAKPSKEIFQRALEKAHSAAEDAIYIGNEPDTDGEGAKAAGIPFLLINRQSDPRVRPPGTIQNLGEVFGYLNGKEITGAAQAPPPQTKTGSN
jgi:putative hydrolase of the HAD superfamily